MTSNEDKKAVYDIANLKSPRKRVGVAIPCPPLHGLGRVAHLGTLG